MQKFDFTAPANGTPQVVNVPGRYIKYVIGNAGGSDTGLIVTPGGKPGSKILLYPGQAMTLPNDGTAGPNAWTVANALGQAPIAGTLVIGNGKIDDNTLSGVVQVVDGGKSRTLANMAFSGCAFVGAVAAQYGGIGLWNPVGSGKRLIVEQAMFAQGGGAGPMSGNMTPLNSTFGSMVMQGMPKGVPENYAAGQIWAGNLGAPAGAANTQWIMPVTGPGDKCFYVPHEPYAVMPGYGLLIEANTVNLGIIAGFEWYEEPNV